MEAALTALFTEVHMDKNQKFAEFVEWIKTIQRDELERWIIDAYWHDQLKDTEINRFFELKLYGIDMRTQKENGRATRSRRKGTGTRTRRPAAATVANRGKSK